MRSVRQKGLNWAKRTKTWRDRVWEVGTTKFLNQQKAKVREERLQEAVEGNGAVHAMEESSSGSIATVTIGTST